MHQRYWEHIRYHWLLLAWLLPGYKVTKVTWVTRVTRVTRLRRLRCLYKSSKLIQGSKVSEVTGVTEGFCWWFSLTSPELQGYEGYGVFLSFKFSTAKMCQICLHVLQVTRLKVTMLFQFFLTNTFKVTGLRGYGDEKCLIHPRNLTYLQKWKL